MQRLFIIFVLFTSVSSFAGTFDLLDEGFYPPHAVPIRPGQYDRAQQASVSMRAGFSSCSAITISPDGWVLTAFHCVTSCLARHNLLDDTSTAVLQYVRPKTQTPNVTCDNLSIEAWGDPELVYLGKGYSSFDDREILKINQKDANVAIDNNSDFAVLKFKRVNQTCVPLATAVPKAGDSIWAIGYPGSNSRPSGYGSNGHDEYTSYGIVYANIDRNEYYKEQKFTKDMIEALRPFYEGPHSIISNMDIYPGNSGSMAVNAAGELVGVNTAIAVPEISVVQNRFYDGIAITYSAFGVRDEIRRLGGNPEQVFSCAR